MPRFDVYEPKHSRLVPFVVDVQADLLSDLQTRVVVPLRPYSLAKQGALPRLHPVLRIGAEEYLMMTADIATVRLSDLAGPVGNLGSQGTKIIDAIEFLHRGF